MNEHADQKQDDKIERFAAATKAPDPTLQIPLEDLEQQERDNLRRFQERRPTVDPSPEPPRPQPRPHSRKIAPTAEEIAAEEAAAKGLAYKLKRSSRQPSSGRTLKQKIADGLLVAGIIFFMQLAIFIPRASSDRALKAQMATFLQTRNPEKSDSAAREVQQAFDRAGMICWGISAGCLVLLVVVGVTRKRAGMPICPACRSRVDPQATICKHCRTAIPSHGS